MNNSLNPKVIGITGHSRAGKDTLFELLHTHSKVPVRNYAFAKTLKDKLEPLCHEMFGKTVFELNSKEKEIFRPILIAYGCAWRALDVNHWVKTVDQQIEWDGAMLHSDMGPSPIPVITDFRFLSEYEYFHSKYGDDFVLVEVVREGAPTPPEEELRNQPLLSPNRDYLINWPTLLPERKGELVNYVGDFLDRFGLIG